MAQSTTVAMVHPRVLMLTGQIQYLTARAYFLRVRYPKATATPQIEANRLMRVRKHPLRVLTIFLREIATLPYEGRKFLAA